MPHCAQKFLGVSRKAGSSTSYSYYVYYYTMQTSDWAKYAM